MLLSLLIVGGCVTSSGIVANAATTNTQDKSSKKVVTYFPSWGVYQAAQQNITVKDIAWDKVTHVNHAFFEITNDFKIQSTDSYADYENTDFGHAPQADWDKYPNTGYPEGIMFGHFGEYKYYKLPISKCKAINFSWGDGQEVISSMQQLLQNKIEKN